MGSALGPLRSLPSADLLAAPGPGALEVPGPSLPDAVRVDRDDEFGPGDEELLLPITVQGGNPRQVLEGGSGGRQRGCCPGLVQPGPARLVAEHRPPRVGSYFHLRFMSRGVFPRGVNGHCYRTTELWPRCSSLVVGDSPPTVSLLPSFWKTLFHIQCRSCIIVPIPTILKQNSK